MSRDCSYGVHGTSSQSARILRGAFFFWANALEFATHKKYAACKLHRIPEKIKNNYKRLVK